MQIRLFGVTEPPASVGWLKRTKQGDHGYTDSYSSMRGSILAKGVEVRRPSPPRSSVFLRVPPCYSRQTGQRTLVVERAKPSIPAEGLGIA